MPVFKATLQHNVVRQQENDQLPGKIMQRPEIKVVTQWDTDKKRGTIE